jgi:GNAT superfamily N-acetyltransferase
VTRSPGRAHDAPTIRRIRRDEGAELRVLRLRALADAPMAFGSTLAGEAAFSDEAWRERAQRGASGTDGATFVAELEGRWMGIATGLPHDPDAPDDPRRARRLFVSREARGHRIGGALVNAVVDWARERQADGLGLWVTTTNRPAIALYETPAPAHPVRRHAPYGPRQTLIAPGSRLR